MGLRGSDAIKRDLYAAIMRNLEANAAVSDLLPAGPSLMRRVCRLELGIRLRRSAGFLWRLVSQGRVWPDRTIGVAPESQLAPRIV